MTSETNSDLPEIGDPSLANTCVVNRDDLVMHDIDRIERLHTSYQGRAMLHCRSWQVSRIIRRDFNCVSINLFFRVRKPEGRQAVEMMLDTFEREIMILADRLERQGVPPLPGRGENDRDYAVLNLRYVHQDCRRLGELLQRLDGLVARVNALDIDVIAREEIIKPAHRCFFGLKMALLVRRDTSKPANAAAMTLEQVQRGKNQRGPVG